MKRANGLLAVLVAGLLAAGGAAAGHWWCAAGLVPLQVGTAWGLALRLRVPKPAVTIVLGVGPALAADAVAAHLSDGRLRPVAAALALGLVAALLAPLIEEKREVPALLAGVAAVVLCVLPAALVTARPLEHGRPATVAAVGAASVFGLVAVLVGRGRAPHLLGLAGALGVAAMIARAIVG